LPEHAHRTLPNHVQTTWPLTPVSRLIRLTTDDIIQQGSEVLIRLGDPPAPVPEPFAALLLELASHQPGITTASTR
jgi:hypothetical protein